MRTSETTWTTTGWGQPVGRTSGVTTIATGPAPAGMIATPESGVTLTCRQRASVGLEIQSYI